MMSSHLRIEILRPISAALLVLCSIGVTRLIAAEEPLADPEAHRLMTQAVEARAVWDEDFPGFTANIQVNYEGRVHQGKVQVFPDGEIELTGLSQPQSPAWSWAYSWLGQMVSHRMGAQESDDRYRDIRMIGGKNHPLGVLLVTDDPFDSSFRVDEKVIRQVNRDLNAEGTGNGSERVRINVVDMIKTPEGKILPKHFVINYFDEKQQLQTVEVISNRFLRLEQYELPEWRRVITTEDGRITTAAMTLSNHHLSDDTGLQ